MSSTVSCKSCGRALNKGDRFCPGCGTTVAEPSRTGGGQPTADRGTNPTQCPACGTAMGRADRFCPKCGASRPEEVTVVSHVSLRNTQAAHLIEATRGEFDIIQQLGTGAMGAVYLAKDIALGRKVAIKVIAPNLLSDETMISRFRLEAQTVASLRHPNIVNVHAVRQSDDLHYFVMEFIDGPPLRNIIKSHAPLDIEVVQALMFQVGSALSYAHRSGGGVIHRDVKPANIMVDKDGMAFVTDFGISKIAEAQTGLTQTGATIGTPEYMSPEQCRGDALTGASDQYALGIVAYEMLCGHTPFSGSQYYIMVAHTSESPKAIRDVRPDCPPQVADAVERMLAKTPQERWPDLDAAVLAMGGAPLGYHSPVRTRVVALTGATLVNVPAVTTGSGQPSVAPADTATSVTVSGIPSVVETGDKFTLEADVRGTGPHSLSGMGVIWASTDPSIARIENGVVEALKAGVVSITATAGNVANSVLLTVAEPSPASVLVRPGSVRIQKGGRIGLSATVQDRKGRTMDRAVQWRSSDASIATVTEQGQVVATGGGTVSIVAESEGASGTAEVVVEVPVAATAPAPAVAPTPPAPEKAAPPTAMAPPAPAPAAPSKPEPPKPAPEPPRPEKKPKPERPAKPPKAPRPATASQPGAAAPLYRRPPVIAAAVVLLAFVGFGVANMGGGDDEAGTTPPLPTQTVANPTAPSGAQTPADPTPEPTEPEPAQPESVQPEPTVTAVDQPAGRGAAPSGAQPSGNTAAPSTAQSAPSGRAGGAAATAPPPAASPAPTPGRVQIAIPSTAMVVGGSQSASATVLSTANARMTTGFTLAWRSTDPTVLTVDLRGTVRGAGSGSAWIVATAGSARDSVLLSVVAVAASIEIAQADLRLEVGAFQALTASVLDADGNRLDRPITWSSSAPAVVAVDDAGRVTARGAGSAQVTASAEGFRDAVSVTVAAAAPVLPTADQAQAAVTAYVTALAGGNEDEVRRLWGNGDADRLDQVVDLMGENRFGATLGTVGEPAAQGAAAVVEFVVNATYRNFAGGERRQALNYTARLERSGSAWQVVSAVAR